MSTPRIRIINHVSKRRTFDATERGLSDDEPREVIGVKGAQSKSFRKRFPNAKAMERWLDGEGGNGDYEIQYIQRA